MALAKPVDREFRNSTFQQFCNSRIQQAFGDEMHVGKVLTPAMAGWDCHGNGPRCDPAVLPVRLSSSTSMRLGTDFESTRGLQVDIRIRFSTGNIVGGQYKRETRFEVERTQCRLRKLPMGYWSRHIWATATIQPALATPATLASSQCDAAAVRQKSLATRSEAVRTNRPVDAIRA